MTWEHTLRSTFIRSNAQKPVLSVYSLVHFISKSKKNPHFLVRVSLFFVVQPSRGVSVRNVQPGHDGGEHGSVHAEEGQWEESHAAPRPHRLHRPGGGKHSGVCASGERFAAAATRCKMSETVTAALGIFLTNTWTEGVCQLLAATLSNFSLGELGILNCLELSALGHFYPGWNSSLVLTFLGYDPAPFWPWRQDKRPYKKNGRTNIQLEWSTCPHQEIKTIPILSIIISVPLY